MKALVLRPEPGNAATAARLAALGVETIRCPLFAVAPLAWSPPDPARFDALLLTSANAARHARSDLSTLAALPVLAVGEATAAAARAAGLRVALTGAADAATLLAVARARGWRHPLHLAGRHRRALPGVEAVAVYDAPPLPVAAATVRGWAGAAALLHSARAARRLAALIDAAGMDRATIALAVLSPAVGQAAGAGWRACEAASAPTDAALVACARALIDRAGAAADKRPR